MGAAAFFAPSFAGRAEGAADAMLEPRRAAPSLERLAADETVREAGGAGEAGGVIAGGGVADAVLDVVRPITGGLGLAAVAGLEATGFGLSQVEKKSSSPPSAAVLETDNDVVSAPSTNIASGYL